jgi:hypothetical protein
MEDYTNAKDRTGRYKQKVILNDNQKRNRRRTLGKVLLIGTMIGITGISCYEIATHPFVYTGKTNVQEESVEDRRARLLQRAENQYNSTQNPQTLKGLNSVIKDINRGVYDNPGREF